MPIPSLPNLLARFPKIASLLRPWSPQQDAFLNWCIDGSGSLVLEAKAGTGKSTTLLFGAAIIPGQVAMLAYNKKIGDELKSRLADAGVPYTKAQAGTVHSFAFSAWRKAQPKVRVYDKKLADMIEAAQLDDMLRAHAGEIVKLVSLAKQSAFGLVPGKAIDDVNAYRDLADHFDVFDPDDNATDETIDAVIKAAIHFFKKSIDRDHLDVIDFEDMIFLPLYYKARFWQFDVVMIDEAQDTNELRRALVRAILKKGGRVIAVGDRHQAIYGFTGADADSLDLIAADFNADHLPLNVTYRCPQAVVKFAQTWVKDIMAHDSAPEGVVSSISHEDFLKLGNLKGGDAVLCRVTKPLVSLAMTCIRNKIACKIEGRDIAAKITKTLKRWKVKSLDSLETKLEIYFERERTKFLAKKQENRVAELEDLVETCKVIIDHCRQNNMHTVEQAVAYTESLFADGVDNILTLSTIHKSKGREWRRVFWLDRAGTCPSRWARQAWQQQQERNLQYVAATRAMHELCDLIAPPKED